LVIRPVKIVPEMTYYVSSGTLNPTNFFLQNWSLNYSWHCQPSRQFWTRPFHSGVRGKHGTDRQTECDL